jgi:D-beta-D-heptose 7-phosphate kinase/D-beta-D-heptose 1-phosphate adenosyltransferase
LSLQWPGNIHRIDLMQRLMDIIERLGKVKIALVGDFILDCYVYGTVERINPEAPVPVLRTVRRASNVGGAGNVAAAVPALGGQLWCFGVVGDDLQGQELSKLLAEAGADASTLIHLPDRPTAVKTRYVGLAQHRHAQQMLRVDEESVEPLDVPVTQELHAAFLAKLPQADIVVLEDYNKGVFTPELTARLIASARAAGKSVVVDPAQIGDFSKYRGATVIKPNRYEAATASGVNIVDDATLDQAARKLMEITQAQAIVITLDKEGSYLLAADQPGRRIPHERPRPVYDITGAGDETLATLAVALASGCDYTEAAELANVAGGLEVERQGFVPVRREELIEEVHRMIGLRGGKVLSRARLAEEVTRRRQAGQTVVFTNGCFDLLHMGHVRYLQQARELGNCLIVAINSDASVHRLKGKSRPVIGQNERAEMLGSLECVDYVTVFDEDTPIPLLQLLRPEVLVKGGSTDYIVGHEVVEAYGGKALSMPLVEGLSTTEIINRIVNGNGVGG